MAERQPETVDQAVHRLAAEAKRKGVQIFVYPPTGEYYATSTSSPDQLHRVTLMSCDCSGFLRHRRCTHHCALLAELDELPKLPGCTACDGAGSLAYPVRITPEGKTVFGSYACGLRQVAEPVDAWKRAS
jgi:hypothetical protein